MSGTVLIDGVEIPFAYVLDVDLNPVPADVLAAMVLMKDLDRRTVSRTEAVTPDGARYLVETLFLVLDDQAAVLAPAPDGPWLWGTSIRPCQDRLPTPVVEYRNVDDAIAGHLQVVSQIREGDLRFSYDSRRRLPTPRRGCSFEADAHLLGPHAR